MQNNSLTEIINDTTMHMVGQTEAGSAEVQPIRLCPRAGSARDNRLIVTDCCWDGGSIAVILFRKLKQFGAFQCLKKPSCQRQDLSLNRERDLSNSR